MNEHIKQLRFEQQYYEKLYKVISTLDQYLEKAAANYNEGTVEIEKSNPYNPNGDYRVVAKWKAENDKCNGEDQPAQYKVDLSIPRHSEFLVRLYRNDQLISGADYVLGDGHEVMQDPDRTAHKLAAYLVETNISLKEPREVYQSLKDMFLLKSKQYGPTYDIGFLNEFQKTNNVQPRPAYDGVVVAGGFGPPRPVGGD